MNLKRLVMGALLAFFAANALAWDDGGHLLIGEIAARRLRPEVMREMEPLVALLDTQFNQGRPYNLVTAGVWLDDQRGLGKENPWARWHYIDFECGQGGNPPEPPPPHALWAMDQAVAVLRDRKAKPKARAEALAQVIHIVGDLHQPLHTADRHDWGGNAVRIAPVFAGEWSPGNLHAFWDAAYRLDTRGGAPVELWPPLPRDAWPRGPGEPGLVSREATEALKSLPPPRGEPPCVPGTRPWAAWARESHAIACQSGWPAGVDAAAPGGVVLSPGFIHEAHALSVAQIVKAGERLADLLNALLGQNPP